MKDAPSTIAFYYLNNIRKKVTVQIKIFAEIFWMRTKVCNMNNGLQVCLTRILLYNINQYFCVTPIIENYDKIIQKFLLNQQNV